jgi:hypothetical protein
MRCRSFPSPQLTTHTIPPEAGWKPISTDGAIRFAVSSSCDPVYLFSVRLMTREVFLRVYQIP